MTSENKNDDSKHASDDAMPVYQPRKSLWEPWVRWSLVALILIAIAVFFWLPSYINKPQINTDEVYSPARNNNYSIEASPWLDAQLARQRKAAQEVLAELLDLQFSLEEKSIRQWAETEFSFVEELAAAGDDAYRSKNFIESAEYYQQGLDKLLELDSGSAEVLEKLISEGQEFFSQKKSTEAIQKFKIALAIDPENTIAIKGLRRSEVLDQVLAFQAEALKNYNAGDLQQALDIIDKALALDKEHTQSKADHSIYSVALKDLEYRESMSKGYKALLEKQYATAELAFNQAARLKPGSAEVATALRDIADKQSLEGINKLHEQAKKLEKEELWTLANARYETALKLDKNLIFARVGSIRTKAREELHNRLEAVLKAPERLSDERIYQNAESLLGDAQSIQQPGKKLLQQIESLQTSLEMASQDITVQFYSDDKTTVRIQRIGLLGSFYSHQIDLKPGTYVATGSRPGFRDVRLEFTVSVASSRDIVTIICNEPI